MIINRLTKKLIRVALQNGEEKTEFTPSDEQFFALLANDNGRGVVHMLRHWCRTLGRKTITKIAVLELEASDMLRVGARKHTARRASSGPNDHPL